MNIFGKIANGLEHIGKNFTLEALSGGLDREIEEVLKRHGKLSERRCKLTAKLMTWFVLVLPLQRGLSYPLLLEWILSGLSARGAKIDFPAVKEGAVSHARRRLGVDVLRDLFYATRADPCDLPKGFHGRTSLGMDGTTATMPDTPENAERFGRPGSGRGRAGFPQVRLVALVAAALHTVVDVVFGPCRGKGTGERTLGKQLILKHAAPTLLFLMDMGFFGVLFLLQIREKGGDFIIPVPRGVKPRRIRNSTRQDGSYLARLTVRVKEPQPKSRNRWTTREIIMRITGYRLRGFRPRRLATSLFEPEISAREIVLEYHSRWEVELVYDEIKTHQCCRRTGQCSTVLRSKQPDLVEQEIYAMVTIYNKLRSLILEAAREKQINPLTISFVEAMEVILNNVLLMASAEAHRLKDLYQAMLERIAACKLGRTRRPRAYPRVVKVKMSNFKRKDPTQDVGVHRDLASEIRILGEAA